MRAGALVMKIRLLMDMLGNTWRNLFIYQVILDSTLRWSMLY